MASGVDLTGEREKERDLNNLKRENRGFGPETTDSGSQRGYLIRKKRADSCSGFSATANNSFNNVPAPPFVNDWAFPAWFALLWRTRK